MEENFGTVGAVATAFVSGFQPRTAVQLKEILTTTAAGSPNILRNDVLTPCKDLKFNLYSTEETILKWQNYYTGWGFGRRRTG